MASPNGYDRIRRYNPRFSTENDLFEHPDREHSFYLEANVNLNQPEKTRQELSSSKKASCSKTIKSPHKDSSSKALKAPIDNNSIHREVQALRDEINQLRIDCQNQAEQIQTGLRSLTKEIKASQMTRHADLEAWQKLQAHVQSMKPGITKAKTKETTQIKPAKTKKKTRLVDVTADLLERGHRDQSREARRKS